MSVLFKSSPTRYACKMGDYAPNAPLEDVLHLTTVQKRALKRLRLLTVRDLLFHFPRSYGGTPDVRTILGLKKGDHVLLSGKITGLKKTKGFRSKTPMTKAILEDHTGKIPVVWFHQPYIAHMIKEGVIVALRGKISEGKNGIYLANPDKEDGVTTPALVPAPKEKDNTATLYPTYPETQGITSRWFYYTLKKIFASGVHKMMEDPFSKDVLDRYHLPQLSSALVWIHRPQKEEHTISARKRFSFEEVFFIQLARIQSRSEYQQNNAFAVDVNWNALEEFTKRFSFSLTKAQSKAVKCILNDFEKQTPMTRLLEGDVGSGKTAVAAAATYVISMSRPHGQDFGNLQTAIMAPTEILAKQHFESFIKLFAHLPIQIGLITGSGCYKFPSKVNSKEATSISRAQLLKWVANGEIPIVVGTHALIQKKVTFKHLACVIIDEQHRFGTMQRYALTKKEGTVPHLLSMTATPIPRTLALTIFGDLDLTILDEMPPGRKPVKTELVSPVKRDSAYGKVRKELENGRQVYVICPRIDEPDPNKLLALNVKSVKEEAVRLKKDVFPDYTIETLHSKMKPAEKEEVMQKFIEREIDILVATSVVEVGVNVPNATTIIIEGADRFGLAQLHQLRGRVLRSTHQSYCFVFTDAKSKKTSERLALLEKAKNGFELAEHDLKLRGPGELSGKGQWGISDVGMEALKNLKMVEAARQEAKYLLSIDPSLKNHLSVKNKSDEKTDTFHFE